jgi:L-alanine-DL-glutamate epimerase-like enolase superfamily enzyme
MKIREIRPYYRKIPLKKPYAISSETFSDVELVFVEIELENGITGYGSGSPAEEVVGENARMSFQHLQSDTVQRLAGADIRHFQQIIHEVRRAFPGLPGTQAALDLALHDAFCRYLGISIVSFYGQCVEPLPTSVTIGIMPPEEALREALEFVRLGFKALKIKTGGGETEQDIELLRSLRETVGKDIMLRVDPNQGYNERQLLQIYEHCDVELIEQPLPVGDEQLLRALPPRLRDMLVADESLTDPATALLFAQPPQPFGVFNIKLMKCGGILAAREIAGIAAHAGIRLFWGCNDESSLSITAALHAAYSCPNTSYLDLDGSFDLAEDLFSGGFELRDGKLIPISQFHPESSVRV